MLQMLDTRDSVASVIHHNRSEAKLTKSRLLGVIVLCRWDTGCAPHGGSSSGDPARYLTPQLPFAYVRSSYMIEPGQLFAVSQKHLLQACAPYVGHASYLKSHWRCPRLQCHGHRRLVSEWMRDICACALGPPYKSRQRCALAPRFFKRRSVYIIAV